MSGAPWWSLPGLCRVTVARVEFVGRRRRQAARRRAVSEGGCLRKQRTRVIGICNRFRRAGVVLLRVAEEIRHLLVVYEASRKSAGCAGMVVMSCKVLEVARR